MAESLDSATQAQLEAIPAITIISFSCLFNTTLFWVEITVLQALAAQATEA
jgi:hypothetical protein